MSYRDITLDELRKVVTYEPTTGYFYRTAWISRLGKLIEYPTPKKSCSTTAFGHIQLSISGEHFLGHRLAWFLTYGEWPNVVDHINGDPGDNRIANLRSGSQAENCQNIRAPKSNNTTGYLGVSFDKARGRYVAAVGLNGKRHVLGRFDTAEQAHRAYVAAKSRLHSHSTIGGI